MAKQSGETIKATIISHQKLLRSQKNKAKAIITRSLGLDIETLELLNIAKKAEQKYVKLIKSGAGRLLRAPSLWEDAAKTLFTTNCSWFLTEKICSSVCSDKFAKPTPSGNFPFPQPEKINQYTAEQLKELIPVGYRAGYLKLLAERFAKDPLLSQVETNGFDYKAADKIVRELKGFADYATAHLLILAGYYNEIPIDTVVISYLKRNHRARKPKSLSTGITENGENISGGASSLKRCSTIKTGLGIEIFLY